MYKLVRDLVMATKLFRAGARIVLCDDTATLLELRDQEYAERAAPTSADTLTTLLLPGLAIPMANVFRHRQGPADD